MRHSSAMLFASPPAPSIWMVSEPIVTVVPPPEPARAPGADAAASTAGGATIASSEPCTASAPSSTPSLMPAAVCPPISAKTFEGLLIWSAAFAAATAPDAMPVTAPTTAAPPAVMPEASPVTIARPISARLMLCRNARTLSAALERPASAAAPIAPSAMSHEAVPAMMSIAKPNDCRIEDIQPTITAPTTLKTGWYFWIAMRPFSAQISNCKKPAMNFGTAFVMPSTSG